MKSLDERATALYDKLNPNWEHEINVSKAECIRRVQGGDKRAPTVRWRATVEQRRLIRDALNLVRNDPAEADVKKNLAAALGGSVTIDEHLLKIAERIVAAR